MSPTPRALPRSWRRLARAGRFQLLVRLCLLLVGLALGLLVALAGDSQVSRLLAVLVVAAVVGCALGHGPVWLGAAVVLLALWAVGRPLAWPVVAALVALVWLAHRLSCWLQVGPLHGELGAAGLRLLLGDAVREAGWVLGIVGLLLAGGLLAHRLPATGVLAWALLALAAVATLAWLSVPRRD
ncbi:hypothetical protein [Luteococcus peritonei]|uniref:Uncharacterized protein n=1 Tax=Luteococcus peritonei TaxID=88874 RepID=A0ABW4RW76_9ACTN